MERKHNRLTLVAALLAVVCAMQACNSPENKALQKRSSSGKTCEVLVAADKGVYQAETKALIDSILLMPQEGLLQPEARFSTVNVPVSSLHNTQMFMMHRNIIICDVKQGNPNKLYIHHNQWAEPQVVVDVAADGEEALRQLLRKHSDRIVEELYAKEYERMARAFYKDRNVDLMRRVTDKYGFSITLPQEFTWAMDDGEFTWLRKEAKDFGLGIFINVQPYRDRQQFDTTRIYNRMDTLMKRNVPGPAEGSYMATERRVEIVSRVSKCGASQYCIESRGLWQTEGDFMGGPFVHYCMLSPDGTQVVELTGYVYSPRFDKRDYLMQVDGICHSIKWPQE